MSEQVFVQPHLTENFVKAREALEIAREAHEKYLIREQNNDLEDAVEYYIMAVKLDPTLSEGYYRLASLMWEKGQISLTTAIEQCKTAITLSPKNMNAHMYTGYFLKMAQDFEAAEKEFKKAIKMSKFKSARPRLILSQSILQKMNAEKPNMKDFTSFLYYFLSGSLMLMWDYPSLKMFYKNFADDFGVFKYKALGTLLEKVKMFPLTMNLYEKAVQNTSHSEIFYHKMGDLSIKCGDMEVGCECYKKALEANSANREVLIKLATVTQTYFPDNTDDAIDYYNTLLEFGEDCAQIYYELGHLYLKKQDKIHAISAFKLALEGDSSNPFYNNSLAYAFVHAELYDDAIEYYQKAIKLNPDQQWTAIVCQALGSIYSEIKCNFEGAVATFQAGIILDPKNYDLHLALGDVYMAENDLDNAIRMYCDAITLDATDFRGYSKAGLALWEKDYIEEAIISYHKAINLNPDYEIAQNNLGVIYLDGLGTPEEALKYFKAAVDINPNYTLAYFNCGRSLQAMGEGKEAADYYQMALDLNKLTEELDEQEILDRIYGIFNL